MSQAQTRRCAGVTAQGLADAAPRLTTVPGSQGITSVAHAVHRALQAVRRRQREEQGAHNPDGAGANQVSQPRQDATLAGAPPPTEVRTVAVRVPVCPRWQTLRHSGEGARLRRLTAPAFALSRLCLQVPAPSSRFNLPLAVLTDSPDTAGSPGKGGGRAARGGGGPDAALRNEEDSSAAKRQRVSHLLPAPSSDHHMVFPQASPMPAPSPGGGSGGAFGLAFPPPSGWAAHTPVPAPVEPDDDPMVQGEAPGRAQEAAAACKDTGVRPPVTVHPLPLSTGAAAHLLVADTPTTVTTAPEAISDDDEESGDVWGRGPGEGGIAPLDLGVTLERVGAAHEAPAAPAAAAAPRLDNPDGGWHIRPGLASQQQLPPGVSRPAFLTSSTQQPAGTQAQERASGWRTAVAATATAPLMAPPPPQPLPGSAARGITHTPAPAAHATTGFGASQGSLAAAWKRPRFAGPEGPVVAAGASNRGGLALSAVPPAGAKATSRAHQTGLGKAVDAHGATAMSMGDGGPTPTGRGHMPNPFLAASSAKRGAGPQGPPAMPPPPHVVEEARRLGLAAPGAQPPVTHGAKAVAARQAAAAATFSPHPLGGVVAPQEAARRVTAPVVPAVVKLTQPSDESGAAADWDEAELRGFLPDAAEKPAGAGEEHAAAPAAAGARRMSPLPDAPEPAPPALVAGCRPDSTEAVVTAAAGGAMRAGEAAVAAGGHIFTFDDVDVRPMVPSPLPPPVGLVTESQENMCGYGAGLETSADEAIPAGMVLAPPVVELLHRASVVRAVHIAGGGLHRVRGDSSSVGDGGEEVVWTVAALMAGSSPDAQGGDAALYIWRCASLATDGATSPVIGPWDACLVGMRRCTLQTSPQPRAAGDAANWFAFSPDGKRLYCLPGLVADAGLQNGDVLLGGGLPDGGAPTHPGAAVSPVGVYALDCWPDKPCGPPGAYPPNTPVPTLVIRAVLRPDASWSQPPTCVTCFRLAEPRNALESVCVAAAGQGGTCALWHAGGPRALAAGVMEAIRLPVAHIGGTPTDTVVSLCPVRTCASAGADANGDGMGPHAACVGTGARLLVGLTAGGQAAAWGMVTPHTLLWVAALPAPYRLLQLAPFCCGPAAAYDEAHCPTGAPPSTDACTDAAFTALARVALSEGEGDVVAAYVSFPAATLAPESKDVNLVRMGPHVPLPAGPLTVSARGGFAMALLAPPSPSQAGAPQEDRPLGLWHAASGAHVAGLGTVDTRCAAWAVEQPAGAAQACVIAAGDAVGRVVVYRLV